MKVLLVEDDPMIGEAIGHLMHKGGDALDWARDGVEAGAAIAAGHYDAVVLDLGLPRRAGLDVLRAVRARGCTVPVLIATARDAVSDRIAGLDAGADDYLLKPFDFGELHARLRALLRRSAGHPHPAYVCGDIAIDVNRREVLMRGAPVMFSAREWMVLEALVIRPGQILSRQQLEDRLYGWGAEVSSNAVEVYVHGIRRKLGNAFVRTIRGLGYQIAPCD